MSHKSIHDVKNYFSDLDYDKPTSHLKLSGFIVALTFIIAIPIFIIIISLTNYEKDNCESSGGEYVEVFRGYDCIK